MSSINPRRSAAASPLFTTFTFITLGSGLSCAEVDTTIALLRLSHAPGRCVHVSFRCNVEERRFPAGERDGDRRASCAPAVRNAANDSAAAGVVGEKTLSSGLLAGRVVPAVAGVLSGVYPATRVARVSVRHQSDRIAMGIVGREVAGLMTVARTCYLRQRGRGGRLA